MSLRTRMVLVAGVAVAIAVIGVAVGSYLGTRSSLLGQTDRSLQTVSGPVLHRAQAPHGEFAPTPAPPGSGGQGVGCSTHGDPDEGLALDRPPAQAFGGASGTYTLVCAQRQHVLTAGRRPSDPAHHARSGGREERARPVLHRHDGRRTITSG